MITRERALELVKKHMSNRNLRRHVYAVEAVMRALARKFNGDEESWALAGLLHDLDYEATQNDPEHHTQQTCDWLIANEDVTDEIIHAIKAHADMVPLESNMDKAIYCADPTTGFLVACALMHPDKKLASLDAGFMLRRFEEKRFAAGASRDQMATCSSLGMGLEDFLLLSRDAMASISDELGL